MRILAAVDVHDQAESVVDRVAPWALRLGAQVDLCHASQWSTEGLPRPPNPGDELDRLWAEWAGRADAERARLSSLAARLPPEVRGAARLIAGPPADALRDASVGYDLLAVASHQRTGLSRLVNGSVSARIVRSAPIPVLVLGLGDPIPDPGEALYVLAPVDLADPGALPWIAAHLPWHRTELVHARTEDAPVWVPGPPRAVFAPPSSEAVGTELADLARSAGFAGAPTHVVAATGNPGNAIAGIGASLGVDLIVLASHQRRGAARALLGSVAERVLERARSAVIVVPWAAAGDAG